MLLGARGDQLTGGEHHPGGQQVVTGQPPLAVQPPDATTQRQAGHPGGRHDAARHGQAEHLGFPVDITPRGAALHAHGPGHRIDPHTVHRAQVQHQPSIDGAVTGDVVPTSPNGEQQPPITGQPHPVDHIRHTRALHDQARTTVDRQVHHPTDFVVRGVTRRDDRPPEQHAQLGHLLITETNRHTRGRHHCRGHDDHLLPSQRLSSSATLGLRPHSPYRGESLGPHLIRDEHLGEYTAGKAVPRACRLPARSPKRAIRSPGCCRPNAPEASVISAYRPDRDRVIPPPVGLLEARSRTHYMRHVVAFARCPGPLSTVVEVVRKRRSRTGS